MKDRASTTSTSSFSDKPCRQVMLFLSDWLAWRSSKAIALHRHGRLLSGMCSSALAVPHVFKDIYAKIADRAPERLVSNPNWQARFVKVPNQHPGAALR